ncbi:MAG TPA: hypothetical protein VL523_05750 [Terriglobia bacterium]|nr:hypothetical protein [Terriglobia bacterium]
MDSSIAWVFQQGREHPHFFSGPGPVEIANCDQKIVKGLQPFSLAFSQRTARADFRAIPRGFRLKEINGCFGDSAPQFYNDAGACAGFPGDGHLVVDATSGEEHREFASTLQLFAL